MTTRLFLFAFLLFAFTADFSRAQPTSRPAPSYAVTRFLEIGVSANAYRGDLTTRYQTWTSAVHAGLKLNFNRRLNSHIGVSAGTFTGQNATYTFTGATRQDATPNTFFKTSFQAIHYDARFNFVKQNGWMIYLSQGMGIIRFTPKDADHASLIDDFSTRATGESYGRVAVQLPTRAGVDYLLPNGYGISLQAGWLNPLTDYLDNISAWGNQTKNDNVLHVRFALLVPLTYRLAK